jgi:hypothetical protein
LKDCLKTSPEVSAKSLQPQAGFFMQPTIRQPDIKGTSLLTEATATPLAPNTSPIGLDIDLLRADEMPVDEKKMWRVFEALHQRKITHPSGSPTRAAAE